MTKKDIKWETIQVKVRDLIPFRYNPRKISKQKKEQLIKSLNDFGLAEIPTINTNYEIISGNQRIKALLQTGQGDQVIDVRIPNRELSDQEVKKYNIISNTHAGEFDFEILDLEFGNDLIKEVGFEILGWEDWLKKIDSIIATNIKEDEFEYNIQTTQTDITQGDLFEIGDHRLLCGDSTKMQDIERLIDTKKIDLVFTDPPYGVAYKSTKLGSILNDDIQNSDLYQLIYDAFDNVKNFVKNETAYYCFYEDKYRSIVQKALEDVGLEYKSNLIWNKGMNLSGADYQKAHENCLYMQKAKQKAQWYGERDKKTILGARRRDLSLLPKDKLLTMLINMQEISTVWDIDRDNVTTYAHPTQKPISLAGRAINNSTPQGAIVLDLFSGSGSTAVACQSLGRISISMELDPRFCQVIIDRLRKIAPHLPILKNGNKI